MYWINFCENCLSEELAMIRLRKIVAQGDLNIVIMVKYCVCLQGMYSDGDQ